MKPIGHIRYITIHTSDTYPDMDIGVAEITEWHVQRGFDTIGYHWVIRRDGTREKGRASTYQGAHVGGHNAGNLGICLVGGKSRDTDRCEDNYTDEQWIALFEFVKALHASFPEALIMGHNGFPGHEARGCPCFDWRKWRLDFHRRIKEPLTQLPASWYDAIDWEEVEDG